MSPRRGLGKFWGARATKIPLLTELEPPPAPTDQPRRKTKLDMVLRPE